MPTWLIVFISVYSFVYTIIATIIAWRIKKRWDRNPILEKNKISKYFWVEEVPKKYYDPETGYAASEFNFIKPNTYFESIRVRGAMPKDKTNLDSSRYRIWLAPKGVKPGDIIIAKMRDIPFSQEEADLKGPYNFWMFDKVVKDPKKIEEELKKKGKYFLKVPVKPGDVPWY